MDDEPGSGPQQLTVANLRTLNQQVKQFHLLRHRKAMASNILVLGAGELGLAVLQALSRHPKRSHARVTVLMRQASLDSAAPDKKKLVQQIRALDVGFEAADVMQATVPQLAAVFAKYDTVVSCNGMGLPPGTQTKLCEAVLEAKVPRYFPWQFGMDYDAIGRGSSQDLFDEQLLVRDMLRGQDATDWLIVSTGLFMSFLLVPEFGVVDLAAKTVRALGSWDNRITVTTPEDIGRVTAELVLDAQGLKNQCVYVAGDTLTYQQLADLMDERFGTQFRRELWDVEELAKQMREDPNNSYVKYRDTFAQGRGVAWDQDKTFNFARGIKMTDVKAYLAARDAKLE
ncbi:NAD(P)-binding protein [Trichoderma gracile]